MKPPVCVSALLESPEAVNEALMRLSFLGIARDRIDVVVSPETARRYYPHEARRLGTYALRYAAVGALTGFLLTSALALAVVLLPGYADAGLLALVQLLGPNVGAIGGAAVGAAAGFFVRKAPRGPYHRALEAEAIVLIVHDVSTSEGADIEGLLASIGGKDVQVS
jgi:hypothetical protein